MATWEEERLMESYYDDYTKKVDYKKLRALENKGKIVSRRGSDIKKGDRIICFNGDIYQGILDIERIEYEYAPLPRWGMGESSFTPNVWGTFENTNKKYATDIRDGGSVIIDNSVKESDFTYTTKAFLVKIMFNGEKVGGDRLELPDYLTVEDIKKGISLSVKEIS